MRRCATGASSTKPRCASRLLASMISSRRSGQRALFERRHERDGRSAAARWRSACRLLADTLPEKPLEEFEYFIRLVVLHPVACALDLDQFGLLEMRHHAGRP